MPPPETTAQGHHETRDGGAEAEVHSVEDVLDRICSAAESRERTSIQDVLDLIGTRSFGPLVLLAGLVLMAPLVGDIPGVSTLTGLVVALTAGQFLVGRNHIWLPKWLLRRSAESASVEKAVSWLRPVARWLDRISRARMRWLTQGAGLFVIALACVIIATTTPLMEVVPFSAIVAGLALTSYGLALIASDGLLAAVALACSVATGGLLFGVLR
ncbi:MAG: exopolysaccharide biosynthesis protein [Acidobacteria bacterium]|nr:exopolysaccharide biosynthesis protein [Acidobacteriota bacterium]